MKSLPHRYITLFLALALALSAQGQEHGNIRDIGYLRSTSPWTASRNPAGLSAVTADRTAEAEIHFNKKNGGLAGIDESDNSIEAGAHTEAYVKTSDRMTFHGKLAYSHFNGKNMGGPIFMNPSYNPINFHESSDTTLGIKNRELYHLEGGLSYRIGEKWAIGAGIDYQTGDQAKLKDPRILNVWMDLGVSAGFRFMPSEGLSLGFNLEYERTLESIKGNIYGTTDKQYFTFIDFGGFYGLREMFDGESGYVAVGSTRPMFNSLYGASIQVEAGRRTKIFNQLTYLRRNGYYGKRSSTTVTFTEHSGNIIEYDGVLLTAGKESLHRIGLNLRYEGLANNENKYRMNTDLGDYTVVEYFGQNRILDRTDFHAALSYTGYKGLEGMVPEWEYGVALSADVHESLTTIYPFYRKCSISEIYARVYGNKSIFVNDKHILTFGIEGLFSTGTGTPDDDGILASSTSETPRSADTCMYRDFEYRTAAKAGGQVRIRYTMPFGKHTKAYVEAADSYSHLLKKAEYLTGNFRNIIELRIGCTF